MGAHPSRHSSGEELAASNPSPAKPHLPSQKPTKPGKHRRKNPPASQVNDRDARIPPCPARSHPTGPEEQKSSGEGWRRELGQAPWPLPVPNHSLARGERGQSRTCQSRWLPVQTPPRLTRHQPSRARALCRQRVRDAAPARPRRAALTGQGQRREHHLPLHPGGGHLFDGSPRPGLAKPNPPSANRACRIRKHPRAALRHARGRGRKSPSASRHRRECQEAGSLLRHPLPARSRPSSPPPRRKRG